jgi:DNA-directed RNA polymerase specialized sigma24 family protein
VSVTIRPVSRAKGVMSAAQERQLDRVLAKRSKDEADYREAILTLMDEGVSYSVMADALKCSKETLRQWKLASGR